MTSAEQFLRRLKKVDLAARAALRASATTPREPDVRAHDSFTAAWWPIRNSHLPRDACRVAAALYFWHPKAGGKGSLVEALRLGVSRRELGAGPTERLVEQLLRASFTVLPGLLLVAVQRLTDGSSFWVVDGTAHKVFKYTLSGSSLGSWAIDAADAHPTGITINPGLTDPPRPGGERAGAWGSSPDHAPRQQRRPGRPCPLQALLDHDERTPSHPSSALPRRELRPVKEPAAPAAGEPVAVPG